MQTGIFTKCFKDKTWKEVCKFSSEVGLRILGPAGVIIY